ncbi:MAG: glycosyltransferase, partial [Candidatus Firestonebacteria bacterium]
HIVTRLEKGGTLSNILALLEGLAPDYDVVLALGEFNSEKEIVNASAARAGYRVVWLPDLVREISLVKDWLSFLDIVDLLLHETPFVFHTHTSKAGFLGRLAAGLTGFKHVIHTPHGHVYYGYFGLIKSSFVVLMERVASIFTNFYIVYSESELQDNIKRKIGKVRQFVIISNGIPEAPYQTAVDVPKKKAELGLPEGKIIIGYAARFARVKGSDVFIEALKLLAGKRADFIGVLAGSGTKAEESKVRELSIELEKQGLVKFLGFRWDLSEVLKTFDVFVLPSRNEGSPLAAVEAQFAGVPVVASAVGSLPAIISHGQTGLLVKPDNPAELAATLDTLLNDRELVAKIKEKAGQKAHEKYNFNAMLSAVKGLYEKT